MGEAVRVLNSAGGVEGFVGVESVGLVTGSSGWRDGGVMDGGVMGGGVVDGGVKSVVDGGVKRGRRRREAWSTAA